MTTPDQPTEAKPTNGKGNGAGKTRKGAGGYCPDRAAEILAEAEFASDATVAKSHGCSTRTIEAYRARLRSEPGLAVLFASKKKALESEWLPRATAFVNHGLAKMTELVQQADPKQLRAVAGAVNLVLEHVAAAGMLSGGRSISAGKQAAGEAANAGANPAGGNGRASRVEWGEQAELH